MDVHPPLAKLLITLAGWLAGFNGNFDFKDIGKDYIEPGVPYVAMRLLPAICGVLTIPTMFLTLKAAGCRTTTAALGAGLVIFGKSVLQLLAMHVLIYNRQRARYSVSSDPS
jgi:dolichyl-phosphate-mannose-protein mannosyltransferase